MWRELFFKNISTYIELINQHLSEEFEPKPLSFYFKIRGGYAFKSKEYRTKGIPVIRISDFQNERIVLDNVRYYDESEELEKYELFEGDIIIAMTGGTIGKLAIVQEGLGKLYLNQRVGKFEIIDSSLFYEDYVYWIARGVEEKVKSLAWGGAQPNVSNKKIESMEFPIPSINIQKRIVQFLSDFETKSLKGDIYFNESIEQYILNIQTKSFKIKELETEINTQKQLLSKLKQSIFQEAIQGKLTADWRNDNYKPSPNIEEIHKYDMAFEFDIPSNWKIYAIGNIMKFQQGMQIEKSLRLKDATDGTLPILRIKNYHDGFKSDVEHIKIDENSLIAEEEDIILTRTGESRGWVLTGYKGVFHNNTFRINYPKDKITKDYLHYYLNSNSVQSFIKINSGKSAQPDLSHKKFGPCPFVLPPFEEQQAIVEKVKNLMLKCQALEEEIKTSEANAQMLMQAVLKEAFDGKKEENIDELANA